MKYSLNSLKQNPKLIKQVLVPKSHWFKDFFYNSKRCARAYAVLEEAHDLQTKELHQSAQLKNRDILLLQERLKKAKAALEILLKPKDQVARFLSNNTDNPDWANQDHAAWRKKVIEIGLSA